MIMSYDEACAHAAIDQGLRPMVSRLTLEKISFRVDQTGGFTMVIFVPVANGKEIGITKEDGWFLCLYDLSIPDDEGDVLHLDASTDQAVSTLRGFLEV